MLEKVHLTNLFLEKQKCLTHEAMMDYYRGKEPIQMSVGDKIEEFMASVTNQDCYFSESSQLEWNEDGGFQLKMLTDTEKALLEIKDSDLPNRKQRYAKDGLVRTFHENEPDIPSLEMAESESKAKYALSISTQRSITLQRDADIKEKLEKAGFQISVPNLCQIPSKIDITYSSRLLGP